MKITLVFPPSPYQTKQTMPPLGIAWLASVLRDNGYKDVSIIDCVIKKYSNDDLIERLKKLGPDVIGLSFGSQNRFQAFETARMIKQIMPRVIVVAGGAHPTLTADDTLKHIKDIDIIGRGEGEYMFLNLIKAIDNKSDLANVRGISYHDRSGVIHHNLPAEPIKNLDELPFPARDLLPIDEYQQTIPLSDKICTSMISGRGCPYSCVYCSCSAQWGRTIRQRSADNVIAEIEEVLRNYKLDGIGFFDEVFTMNKQRAIAICQKIIKKKLGFLWWCEARANTIDKELVAWMRRAGCDHISMAIESGSSRILKNIKKAITIEQGIEAAKTIKEAGIKLKACFMHGLPGETYKDIKKTVFVSRYLENKFGVDEFTQSLTIIYPGTELELIAKQEKTLPQDFSWSLPFEETRNYKPLTTSKYMPIFEQPNLTYEQTFSYVKRAKMVYYLTHPIQLIKNLPRYKKTIKRWLTTKVK